MICRHQTTNLTPTQPLVRRAVALGYVDGPTTGVAECNGCGQSLHFEAIGWDDDQTWRVYVVRELPPDSLELLASALTSLGEPHWPIWVPIWSFRDDTERQLAERAVREVVEAVTNPVALFESEYLDGEVRALMAVGSLSPSQAETLLLAREDATETYRLWREVIDQSP